MKHIEVSEIESSVPVPVRRSVPLAKMDVGDSIEFPEVQRSSIASNASRTKKTNGKEFTIRKTGEGVCRIWRTK